MRLALKIDVDTLRGTREGVPTLVELLRKHGVTATFLFSLGPDHTGRAIKRVFRPGFVGKVRRTSVVRHYGVRTLLYGTLLPGPDIGRRAADVLQGVRDAGHETGVHCWDHIRWQDGVAAADAQWTHDEMRRACERYTEIFREPPRTHGAAGWQMNVHALRLTQRLGFDYCSDGRGTHPHLPVWNAEPVRCPQFPTTLPDARRADRHSTASTRPTWPRICSRARASPRPATTCSRCTPSSKACASRRRSSSCCSAGRHRAGRSVPPGRSTMRWSRWRCRAARWAPARCRAVPVRCWCRVPSSWARSTWPQAA